MRARALLMATAAVVMLVRTAPAQADLAEGRALFSRGEYAAARNALAKVQGADLPAARALLVQVALRLGDLAEAERTARTLVRAAKKAQAADAGSELADVLLATGRYSEARAALELLARQHPDHLRARYLLGITYRHLGEYELAEQVFERFFADYNAKKIDLDKPLQAMYIALAARYLGSYQDANDAFREAIMLDGKLLEANIEWGYLFLEKYSAADAEDSFDEVLKIDPKHPDAHVGMARVKLEQSYDVAAAQRHLAEALKVNPKHVGALLTRALLEIDGNQWPAAEATLAEVLAVNPNEIEARALLATIAWLRDDNAGYERERQAAFAINPKWADFYHIVARSAEREHRYRQAIELEEQAVALDPKFYLAMQAIGSGYLRLGEESKGVEWLQRAWKGDRYNVRTVNLLDLFEEVIPRDYEFTTSKFFKIRYRKTERPLLERFVEPTLQRAYASMVSRYHFKPKAPTTIELFENPEHYSVRTVGLPNLGALGVCFGRVITAMSPSSGSINWAMVLWHELGHVFAIQISKSRVPRWYTEGLSEYETLIARPEWRRENDADVWAALQAGALPSVVELNYGFTKPSMDEVVVAYHSSSLAIEYIAKTWGFETIVEGLRLFGAGKDTAEVIQAITGQTVAEFDAGFRSHLEKRFAAYRGTFRLPTGGFDDLTKLEIAVDAAPDSADAHARLGLGFFYAAEAGKARAAMGKALKLDPKNRIALYVIAELLLRERKYDEAAKRYRELIDAGGDGYEPRLRLGFIAIRRDDVGAAETELARAKKLDPERSDPYMLLAEMYEGKGQPAKALVEYEGYVRIEEMQFGPIKHLVQAYAEAGNWKKVREFGELGVNVNPYDGELLMQLAEAYVQTGDPTRALYTYDSALLTEPKPRRPALIHIGRARAYLALDNKKQARAALGKALRLEPRNRSAEELRKKLR